jgi:hypothetical protein
MLDVGMRVVTEFEYDKLHGVHAPILNFFGHGGIKPPDISRILQTSPNEYRLELNLKHVYV